MELHRYKLFLIVFMVYSINDGVKSQTYDNMTNLQSTLLTSYSTCVRPVLNQSDTMNVHVSLTIYQIVSVDAVRGIIEFVVQISQTWVDERMTWQPSDYGGLTQTTFDVGQVFYPKVLLSNSLEVKQLSRNFMTVLYSYDGTAYHNPGDIIVVTCKFHMTYWPFDKQICSISLLVYGFTSTQVSLSANNPPLNTAYFIQGGEWWIDLDSFETKVDNSHLSQLHFKFKMNRQSTYYILTIIIPIATLGYLSGMSFFLPSDADTRSNFQITILLALAVFLGVVSEDIPRGSETVPIFCIFLVYAIGLSCILTVINIINARIFLRSNDIPVSKFYRKLVQIAKFRRNKVDIQRVKEESNGKSVQIFDVTDNEEFTTKYTNNEELKEDDAETNVSWEDVSLAIDRIILVLLIPLGYFPCSILIICCAALSDYKDPKIPF